MPAHAAIQYSRESFDTRVGEMLGRRMAGETFLKAWVDYADADPVTAWVHSPADARAFPEHVRELGATGGVAVAGTNNFTPLREAGTLWLADPAVGRHAWERRWFAQDAWSIVGITHTIASQAALEHIANLLIAPVQPWDALICTSRAAKQVVRTLLEEQATYLAARMGATRCTGPELPIIPLGVSCDALAPDPAARARWRAELGIGPDEVAVLHFGRLSFHLKAHPQPLYLALQQAAARGGPRLHLILAGQFANPGQGERFRTLAQAFSGSITTHFVDGAHPDAGTVRSAADIFTLLSDNIQESFGLAPVEAMAAGLPVVGSDWDGLRDTIEHGVTGFLIDTMLPVPGAGVPIAQRHAFGLNDYSHYTASVAQATAVDIGKAADAFASLAADRDLRVRMGEAGRLRARTLFDWSKVIGSYRQLIDELAAIRRRGGELAQRPAERAAQPVRMDPFALFAGYPTETLGIATKLVATGLARRVADLPGGLEDAIMVRVNLPPLDQLDAMLTRVTSGPVTLIDLLGAFPGEDRRLLVSGIAFLLKMGLIARA
jgi:glycosyltransferase involved in cell wall biosynthesis